MTANEAEAGDPGSRWSAYRSCLVATSEGAHPGREALFLALRAAAAFGDQSVILHRCDPVTGRLHLVAAYGLSREKLEEWAQLHRGQDLAPTRAVRRDAFVWEEGDHLGVGASGTASVPLNGAAGPVGVLSVLTKRAGEPDDIQRSFLHSVGVWTAARLEGLPPAETAAADFSAEAELTLRMGALTTSLAEAVTSREVAHAVAEHVLPAFGADGLGVCTVENGRVHVLYSTGYSQDFLDLIEGISPESIPAGQVMRTGDPWFVGSRAEVLWRYPAGSKLTQRSPKAAGAQLPLIAQERAVGFCVVSFEGPHTFSERERALLTALGGLVGQALERARLYDVEHARAQALQRGLLPRALPSLPAARAAARYLPAGRGEEVGGDWYDVIPLSADRVAMVIGDVMGHGITEAAAMGQLRTAVRTLSDLEIPPDELLVRLSELSRDLNEDFYATCLYAIFDPVARTFTFSLAGHPPPAVVHPDGTVHIPDVTPDPPLGAAGPPFEVHRLELPDECLLVLYTDGLIESRTQPVDRGLDRLREVLARSASRGSCFATGDAAAQVGGLEEMCDAVVSTLLPDREQTSDDAALLVAHARCSAEDDVASRVLPDDVRAAGQAREYVRERLASWGLDELIMTTELLVSELVANVIRHGKGSPRLRLLRSRSLVCEVYDSSLSTPHIRHPSFTDEGGRGLQLVAALATRWGARYLPEGKYIWTEQDIPGLQRA